MWNLLNMYYIFIFEKTRNYQFNYKLVLFILNFKKVCKLKSFGIGNVVWLEEYLFSIYEVQGFIGGIV